MFDKAILERHFAYTIWATNRLLKAVSAIPAEQLTHEFGTADKNIVGTLAHVFGADRLWLDRVQGRPRTVLLEDRDRDLAVLCEDWPKVHAEWREWIGGLEQQQLDERFSYRDMRGNPYQNARWEIVLHVVNHGTHHRGQVSGFLRTLGHVPPPLDLMQFYREL